MDRLKFKISEMFSNKVCAICERPKLDARELLCHYCDESLPHTDSGQGRPCFRCGIAIPSTEVGTLVMQSCGACLAKDPLQYRSVSAFDYLFPLPELIAQVKFQRQIQHVDLLAELFAKHCLLRYREDSLPQLIIPVPLHPHREFKRSFNQAELISARIAKKMGMKCKSHLVHKIRHTPSQMELSIKERKRNMKNAFALSANFHQQTLGHVAIFDDVVTTGSTTQSIGLLLKRAGVQRIDIWSLARTPKPK